MKALAIVALFIVMQLPAAARADDLLESLGVFFRRAGCCSYHGGESGQCSSGRSVCRDGSISPSCTCSGGSPTPRPTVNSTRTPTKTPTPRPQVRLIFKPNLSLSVGDILSMDVTEICTPGYSASVRDVSESAKLEVFSRYNVSYHPPGAYEVDHIIPLELGGSNEISNLFPQSYTGLWNARVKDRLENKLHRLVCKGRLDLATAQRAIARNWIGAYKQYFGRSVP